MARPGVARHAAKPLPGGAHWEPGVWAAALPGTPEALPFKDAEPHPREQVLSGTKVLLRQRQLCHLRLYFSAHSTREIQA